jgi:pSer/pThr/pTyr-binding forkhead associated (FHA) protein
LILSPRGPDAQEPFSTLWHHRNVSSSGLDHLARIAYEAHRDAHPTVLPSWEDTTEQDQQAWRAAVSAVNVQTGHTVIESAPTRSLVVQAGDQRHSFHTEFTAGRLGSLPIGDDFASGHHARFYVAHGLWFVEDLGSTNGTRLNGRRILGPQRLKKGDKIKIGHTTITVSSA